MSAQHTDSFTTHAQHGEDKAIHDLLDRQAPTFAVDVGANDGQSWSNTYAFGQLGFNLLLVEPMPVYAQRCSDLYAGNDRIIVENVAVGPLAGETTFYVSADKAQDELAMRSSLDRDAVPYDAVEAITVRTAPLVQLLEKHCWPERYAFLSVDAEGFDLAVLQSARLDRYRPSVICVEEGPHGHPIEEYLLTQGYQRKMTLGPNGLYVG